MKTIGDIATKIMSLSLLELTNKLSYNNLFLYHCISSISHLLFKDYKIPFFAIH